MDKENVTEWDRLWKEVYGDPVSEIAIKTKALGDAMQKKIEAIKTLCEDIPKMMPSMSIADKCIWLRGEILEILEVNESE